MGGLAAAQSVVMIFFIAPPLKHFYALEVDAPTAEMTGSMLNIVQHDLYLYKRIPRLQAACIAVDLVHIAYIIRRSAISAGARVRNMTHSAPFYSKKPELR